MSWCKAVLTGQQIAAGELISLVNDFEFVFTDLDEPQGMAVFQGETTPGGTVVYFSPGCTERAVHLIAAYSGTTCETPGKEDLTYLAGDMSVLDSMK